MLVKYYFKTLHTVEGWQIAMKFKALIEAKHNVDDVMRLNLSMNELHDLRREAKDHLAQAMMIGMNKRYEQFEVLN
jgi:hypothetical protein